MGLLQIHGIIDLQQFWPQGSSDADTTKIKLIVGDDSFEYQENDSADFETTLSFKDAVSKGQGSKTVINTSKKDGTQTITIRLQGIDAPELHYKAAALKKSPDVSDEKRAKFNSHNEERRQYFAESATVSLAEHLANYANEDGLVEATFQSRVDYPYEVVDTYGRFIGNIVVGVNADHNLNLWLLENGWAQPAFYTSMEIDEIQNCLEAWAKGKKLAGRLGKNMLKDAGEFDWDLLYRKPDSELEFEIGEDKGKVLMPKIFRRQTAWMVCRKSGVVTNSTKFNTYLKKSPDQLILLDEYIELGLHSAPVYNLHDFISTDNRVEKNPEDLVFKEKPGTLLNADGDKVVEW